MKNCFHLIVLCVCILGFTSCGEDVADIIEPPTNAELLTADTWRMVAETVDPPIMRGGVPVSDTYAQNNPCDNDDEITFSTSQKFTVTMGPTTCSSGTSPYQLAMTGAWQFIEDDEKMVISDESYTYNDTVSVVKLTKNQFVISESWESSSSGLRHTRTTTMEHVE